MRQKRPVLLDRVADKSTGRQVEIEKTAAEPWAAAQLAINATVERIETINNRLF